MSSPAAAVEFDEQISSCLPCFGERGRTPLLSCVEDGHPFSAECVAEWVGRGEFRVVTKWPSLRASDPARAVSLLWHHHDAGLEDLRSMVLQGWLLAEGEHTVFRLAKKPVLSGIGPFDQAVMFRKFDRSAEKYLADHGLSAPVVNEGVFEALVAEVRGQEAG